MGEELHEILQNSSNEEYIEDKVSLQNSSNEEYIEDKVSAGGNVGIEEGADMTK